MSDRRLLAVGWVGVLVVLAAARLDAQPYLVKNINEAGSGFLAGSDPIVLGVAGGSVIFSADDVANGREPWASDGTAAGTRMLIDLTPGPESAGVVSLGSIGGLLLVQGGPDNQVWSTDGTASGTVRLTFAQLGQVRPYGRARVLGTITGPARLLFALRSPIHFDWDLWVSDGTPEGTRVVAELDDFPNEGGASLGAELLFENGFGELWASDGTRAGTGRVRSFDSLDRLVALDEGRAILVADDGTSGRELWVSDGTPAGTRLVVDLVPGEDSLFPTLLSPGGAGRVFFAAFVPAEGSQLWSTDGTAAGTFSLTNGLDVGFSGFQVVGGLAFTDADDGVHGVELLASDGTFAGTRLLDLCPGACSSFPFGLRGTSLGVLFVAFDDEHGYEPWLTDGTPGGTRLLADLCPGTCDSSAELLADLGGLLVLFRGFEVEAWVTDGTPAGTRPLAFPPALRFPFGRSVGVVDGVAVFAASDDLHGEEPWRTDGTEAGTSLLGDLALDGDVDSRPAFFERIGDEVFFAAASGLFGSPRLWRTDGTETGTEPVDVLATDGFVANLLGVGEDLFVVVRDHPRLELWRTDGTGGGTVRLFTDELTSTAGELAALGSQVYVFGSGLWKSGRTPGSAQKLADLVFGEGVAREGSGALDGRLFFSAAAGFGEGDPDLELWSTDGTPAGTRRVRDIQPGSEASRPRDFAVLGNRLYFLADHAGRHEGLWRTDGTETGTELVHEYEAFFGDPGRLLGRVGGSLVLFDGTTLLATDGAEVSIIDGGEGAGSLGRPAAVPLGNRLYFVARVDEEVGDGISGRLWRTDGTLAGTGPSEVLPPGHLVQNLFAAGGRILLLVRTPLAGQELWVTDGAPAGSRRIAGLAGLEIDLFGLFEDGISPPIALGDQLLFAADGPVIGYELWGADLDARLPPFALPAAPSELGVEASSESGVRLTWRDNSADEASFRITGTTAVESLGGSISVPAGTSSVIVQGLPPETPFSFTVAAVNALGVSAESNEASGTPLPAAGPCAADGQTLCLLGGRFAVSVLWRDQHNDGIGTGGALPFPGSDQTGLFWFFNPANVELIVKALDGRPITGAFWSFYGALSDVEYWVTVVDTATRRGRTYHNRPEEICGVGDTGAFPEVSPLSGEASASPAVERREEVPVVTWPYTAAVGEARSAASGPREELPVETWAYTAAVGQARSPTLGRAKREDVPAPTAPAAGAAPEPGHRWRRLALPAAEPPSALAGAVAAGSCTPGPEVLCLLGGRLRVEVFWQDQHNGGSGPGKAVPGTDKAGFFWFFNPANVELVVKALDGTGVNGHLWVFYGALSDVEYTIAVTDTTTGLGRSYHNPPGEICGDADTEAF